MNGFDEFYEEMFEGPKNESSLGSTLIMNFLASTLPNKAYEWCRIGLNCFSVALQMTHDENKGLYSEEVRSVYKCDALQHLEMLVDLLDTKHDAVASYAYAGLSCGCMIGMFLGEIACHLCQDHEPFYKQENGQLDDMMRDWIDRYQDHVEKTPSVLHNWLNVVTKEHIEYDPEQAKHNSIAKKLLGDLDE